MKKENVKISLHFPIITPVKLTVGMNPCAGIQLTPFLPTNAGVLQHTQQSRDSNVCTAARIHKLSKIKIDHLQNCDKS